jgi:hypothetical protein
MNASAIDALVSLAGGIYVCLIGFGIVSPSKNKEKAEIWRKKWGGFMRVAGPLIALWGVYQLVAAFAPATWQRVSTKDGHASAEFPSPTTSEAAVESPGGIAVKRVTVRCNVPGKEIDLRLSYSEIPTESANLTVDQRLDAFKAFLRQQGLSLISCAPDRSKPLPSYRIVSETRDGRYRSQMQIVISPTAVYRAIATSSTGLVSDPAIGRFMRSFVVQ